MPIDQAAWQSPEHLLHGLAPEQSAHVPQSRGTALWALGRMVRDWTEAYRRIVGTSGCRQPATRRPLPRRPRWSVLSRSPSRTAIARRDVEPAASLVTAAWVAEIDSFLTSSASSTPPSWMCCNDWLNPPWLPWSLWWMTSLGLRCCSAMFSADSTSSAGHALTDGPAHDASAPYVEHDGQVDEAGPGWHVGHVGDPELVRAVGFELAFDQVGCGLLVLVAARGHDEGPAPADAADVGRTHEPRHALSADDQALVDQFGAHARHAVGRVRLGMNAANALGQDRVVDRSLRRRSITPSVVAAGRDIEYAAHRAHRDSGLVRVHEFEDPMDVLSPFTANQAVAFARMSRSCLSWRFSRRKRASSSRSALLSTSLPRRACRCQLQLARPKSRCFAR